MRECEELLVNDLEKRLLALIQSTPELMETARVCLALDLPNYYVAGGALTQLIWNHLDGRPPLDCVKDFDVLYFDAGNNPSQQAYEDRILERVSHEFPVDVKNQAIVHEWYPCKFGCSIEPYVRVEQGIESWLSAFALGFRLMPNGELNIYAPYGLQDAFNRQVKPNKRAMTRESYENMTTSYKKRWSGITVEPWDANEKSESISVV